MNEILSVENLITRFDTFERSIIALDSVNLKLYEGEMLGIVGGAGSGKSVLLKSILNLVPDPGRIVNGKVYFNSEDLLIKSEEELREIRGRDISLILPNPRTSLDPLQKVGEQIANARRSHAKVSMPEALDLALDMLRKVGIPDPVRRMGAYPHELSGGMCQRILIGIALINSPKFLLADEISSGLDVTVQRQVLDLLAMLISDYQSSTIIVTRDFGVVANYCNRIAVMSNGKIVEMDDVEYFFNRARHPVSLQLLRSAFAAKGKRETEDRNDTKAGSLTSSPVIGELQEIEPGHFVRIVD